MRRNQILLLKIGVVVWLLIVYILVYYQPVTTGPAADKEQLPRSQSLRQQIDKLEHEISEQSQFYISLLEKLKKINREREESKVNAVKKQHQEDNENKVVLEESLPDELLDASGPVLPILLIACNREAAVRRSLDLLIKYRKNPQQFPIIVSQDCGHRATRETIQSYGDQVTLIQQPDLSTIDVPTKERKFKGYFLIARHYKWALDQIFHAQDHEAVIIVEDDLDIAPDFYEYFQATYPILQSDPSLWCISAWNDNGKAGLVDTKNGSHLLYRTDFFPGLGWMMTRKLWDELGPKWPRSYWDDWVRAAAQRQDRACIRPEISRTRTFGKKGVSNGLFYEKHLKYISLNDVYVPFTKKDLTYLIKERYDPVFEREVQNSPVVSINDLKSGNLPQAKNYRLIYHTKDVFKRTTKALGLMDDFKDGVPRTSYRGVISFFYNGHRVFLAPNNNWKGYDPSWS